MKKTSLFIATILGVALIFGATGCKHKPVGITQIPGMKGATIGSTGPGGGILPTGEEVKPGELAIDPNGRYAQMKQSGNYTEDREKFAAQTIYFDTDSATIKKSEQEKLQHVADAVKGDATNALEIEGHCDERGTEGYNQTLGNKRALAIREYLANLGVPAGNIGAVSFGESKPADPGHNEAAFAKNRRGVFVVLVPKQ